MELTNEQKDAVAQWVEAGAGLSEVQKRLGEEFGLNMTYMDVRFLLVDLDIQVKDRRESRPAQDLPSPSSEGPDGIADAGGGTGMPGFDGGVTVTLDRVMKPESLVSGTVAFSDGVSAKWSLDQLGRLALEPSRPGYRPSEKDLQAFQVELRETLENRGF